VPINMRDDEIDRLERDRDRNGKVWLVKDIIVRHIIEANQWKRPIYLAVTVPEQMGLEKQLQMEGLVYRVLPEPPAARLNVARTMDNLHNKYLYRGFLTTAGDWDYSVFKDDQSTKLLQNYAAAYVQLALELYDQGRMDEALLEMDRARKISPSFPGVILAVGLVYERLGKLDQARDHYLEALKANPDQVQIISQLGHVMSQLGDTAGAIPLLEKAISIDPQADFNPYVELIGIHLHRGDVSACVRLLREWLAYHPDDQRALSSLEMLNSSQVDSVP
jgi:tetratricopeptide (TPR) repeat protein